MVSDHLAGFMDMAKMQIGHLRKAQKLRGPEREAEVGQALTSLEGIYRSMIYIVLHPEEYQGPAKIR